MSEGRLTVRAPAAQVPTEDGADEEKRRASRLNGIAWEAEERVAEDP
jgi:hypothetical protein